MPEGSYKELKMTINEAISSIDETHINTVSFEQKKRWLCEAEAWVMRDIMLADVPEALYADAEGDEVLLAPLPFDALYPAYLDAQLYYVYREFSEYAAAAERFDRLFAEYAGWYAEKYHPACKTAE